LPPNDVTPAVIQAEQDHIVSVVKAARY